MRLAFYIYCVISLGSVVLLTPTWPGYIASLWLHIPFIVIGLYDIFISKSNVLSNYPVIGHIRYLSEFIRPEIQQYFIASNTSGRPFNRETRNLVERRASNLRDTLPFGTLRDITEEGYQSAYHSMHPTVIKEHEARVQVGGPLCRQPYSASRLNISAMSYGALSQTAIKALNKGAAIGGFAHNTGEGGLSPYHLQGGDVIFQMGTAYFGCRTEDGYFDSEKFKTLSAIDEIKMIEIKISQGAKPSHGGVLPGVKVDQEIAAIRGIPIGKTCLSPPSHSAFTTPVELCEFIATLRQLSDGKPIGFKLCLGKRSDFLAIVKAMQRTNITPDFITVDGAEGGTGAAPVEFSNYLGTTVNEAIAYVHSALVGVNLRDRINIIASGKVADGFDMVTKIALGADICNAARAFMFSIGCIQALRCDANTCPTGVTSNKPARYKSIDVPSRAINVANYQRATVESFLDICGAMGLAHVDDLTPHHINRRVSGQVKQPFEKFMPYLQPGELLTDTIHEYYREDWFAASAEHF